MPVFIVSYEHPDMAGWMQHIHGHVQWIQDSVRSGAVLACGPELGRDVGNALLVVAAEDRADAHRLISTDPAYPAGLMEHLSIREWDPMFGPWNEKSSQPGRDHDPPVSLHTRGVGDRTRGARRGADDGGADGWWQENLIKQRFGSSAVKA